MQIKPRAVIVHSLDQAAAAAAAAAELGVTLTVLSAPGAGGYAGPGWFAGLAEAVRARFPALEVAFVLDCADEAGTVQAALRRGLDRVRFDGPPEVAAKLAALGARLDPGGAAVLVLLGRADPLAACRKFLAEPDAAR
jgi:hypothetical protein